MTKLLSSRKLWGALLGSLSLMGIVLLTSELHMATAIMVTGGLWAAAIGGQAYADVIREKK